MSPTTPPPLLPEQPPAQGSLSLSSPVVVVALVCVISGVLLAGFRDDTDLGTTLIFAGLAVFGVNAGVKTARSRK